MNLNVIRLRWLWPGVILVSAAATSLFFFRGIASPFRLVTTLWFLLVCPGMAFVRLLRLETSHYEWTLAIAMSIALDAIVASLLVYARLWSAELGLSILIVLSLLGAFLQVLETRPQPVPTQPEADPNPQPNTVEGLKCPRCHAEQKQRKAGLNRSGSQRYRCGRCGKGYTLEPSRQITETQTPPDGVDSRT